MTDTWFARPLPFYHKPNPIRGVKVTLDNAKEVARWCGGELLDDSITNFTNGPIMLVPSVSAPDGKKELRVGQWLFKDHYGRFQVAKEDLFRDTFEFDKEKAEREEPHRYQEMLDFDIA